MGTGVELMIFSVSAVISTSLSYCIIKNQFNLRMLSYIDDAYCHGYSAAYRLLGCVTVILVDLLFLFLDPVF